MVGPFLPDDEKMPALREALPSTAAGIYLNTGTCGPIPRETAHAMAEAEAWELRTGRADRNYWEDSLERRAEARAAVAAVLGHVFPLWLGFRGGKGVASALGVFLALNWPSAVGILLVFAVVFALTRYVSLASIVGLVTFPLFGFYFVAQHTPITPMVKLGFLFIPLLIIVKHHGNIRRLLSGKESRFRVGSGSGTGTGEAEA